MALLSIGKTMENETMYINVLITSLQRKASILEQLDKITEEQSKLLKEEIVSADDINDTFEKKEKLIEELNRTDDGFEAIYTRVRGALTNETSKYELQVKNLQELIKKITDLSVNLQAKEHRNKELMERFFKTQKMEIKNKKSNHKAAAQYYQNMANQHRGQSYFLDKKE